MFIHWNLSTHKGWFASYLRQSIFGRTVAQCWFMFNLWNPGLVHIHWFKFASVPQSLLGGWEVWRQTLPVKTKAKTSLNIFVFSMSFVTCLCPAEAWIYIFNSHFFSQCTHRSPFPLSLVSFKNFLSTPLYAQAMSLYSSWVACCYFHLLCASFSHFLSQVFLLHPHWPSAMLATHSACWEVLLLWESYLGRSICSPGL